MWRRLALVITFAAALAGPAFAQMAVIAPTPTSPTENSNRIATTAWVNSFVNAGLPLPSGQIWIGSVGSIATPQTPSGDLTMSVAGAFTLATVNANIGAFGSATQCATITVNAKGLITAASATTCTPAVGSITGLAANMATWLATSTSANLRAAVTDETGTGALYFQGGDIGTPSAGVGTNLTGLNATQLTTGIVPNARLNLTVLPELRISYTTGVPVLTAAVTGATSVFVTPYNGNLVSIFDGTNMVPTAFAEVSQLANDATKSPAATAASKIYNIYCWVDSGTNRCTRGAAWTTDTAPSETLVRVNGVLLNNASITNGPAAQRGTYMGVVRSDASSTFTWSPGGAASGGTAANLTIWNMYNRVQVIGQPQDSGTAYTYSAGTVRQARASAGNQVNILVGIPEETAIIAYAHREQTVAVAGAGMGVGIGLDSTSSYSAPQNLFSAPTATALSTGATAGTQWQVPQGFHFVSANENSDGANASTFNHGTNNQLFVSMRM